MNKHLSEKIRILSFFAIIMVVFIHSYNSVLITPTRIVLLNKGCNLFIQNFLSHGIARIAVPFFFCFSGYLLFLRSDGTFHDLTLKIKNRVYSLVIPYFFWSLAGLLFYFLIRVSYHKQPVSFSDLITTHTLKKLSELIFMKPTLYQLWFLRDLIILVFLSPFQYWLIKNLKYWLVLILLGCWFLNFNFRIFSNESQLFFAIGSYISIYKKELLLNQSSKKYLIYTSLWIVTIFIKTILMQIQWENMALINIIHKTSILTGMLAVWGLYDHFIKNKKTEYNRFYSLTGFTFFIYVTHEPMLTAFKKILFYAVGNGEFGLLVVYITAPLLTLSICILIGCLLKRATPEFYKIITGKR